MAKTTKKTKKRAQSSASKVSKVKPKRAFSRYKQAIDYLFTKTDYERQEYLRYNVTTFNLDRMKKLLSLVGNPHKKIASVHIAGSKGKGSTATMLAKMLESNGYTVHETESAEQALEMVKRLGRVDLVITDIVLLGMSGPELAEELKIIFPELSVMFISGFAGKALEYINDMQANTNVLRKPFTRNLLLNKTAQLIQ